MQASTKCPKEVSEIEITVRKLNLDISGRLKHVAA